MDLLDRTDSSIRRLRKALADLRRPPRLPSKGGIFAFAEEEEQRRVKDEYLHARQELKFCVDELREVVSLLEMDDEILDDMPLVTRPAKELLDRAAEVNRKDLERAQELLDAAGNALGESEAGESPFPVFGSGRIWDGWPMEIVEPCDEPIAPPDPSLGSASNEPESLESLLGRRKRLPGEKAKES